MPATERWNSKNVLDEKPVRESFIPEVIGEVGDLCLICCSNLLRWFWTACMCLKVISETLKKEQRTDLCQFSNRRRVKRPDLNLTWFVNGGRGGCWEDYQVTWNLVIWSVLRAVTVTEDRKAVMFTHDSLYHTFTFFISLFYWCEHYSHTRHLIPVSWAPTRGCIPAPSPLPL